MPVVSKFVSIAANIAFHAFLSNNGSVLSVVVNDNDHIDDDRLEVSHRAILFTTNLQCVPI